MCALRHCLLLCIIIANSCSGSERTLTLQVNPGRNESFNTSKLTFYLRADGPNDTLHYVWDFRSKPSVLLAVTSTSSKLNIDWDNYLLDKPSSINFSETPSYTFGLSFEKILEFNDTNDMGSIENVSPEKINILNPQYFDWSSNTTNISNHNEQYVEWAIEGNNYRDPISNITRSGTVHIVLNGFCSHKHSDITPHMLHSENSSQIDFIIDHLESNKSFTQSRFGIELMMISHGTPYSQKYPEIRRSLNDEHAPGIFEVVEVKADGKVGDNAEQTGYLQWRPVSYISEGRNVINSSQTVHYQLHSCSNISHDSLWYKFYGDGLSHLMAEKIKITFGAAGDAFYPKTNYSTWTAIIGYGTPPEEVFSYLVIMIISIGVGLPILMLSVAAIYSCIRRIPRNRGTRLVNS